jgi:hypothetical protein
MEESPETSRVALKIVFLLSLLLVSMDILEFYFEYAHLKEMSVKFDPILFEDCIKYHALSQMFFTFFATFAGVSATFMSLGLLIDYEFFSFKVVDTFLYYNYLIFGPYLFTACTLGFYHYDLVLFNCDSKQLNNKKNFNFSTLLALVICALLSFLLTFGYAVFFGIRKLINSIRFTRDGNYILGRIFWRHVFSRSRQTININEQEMRDIQARNENQSRLLNNADRNVN